MHHEIGHWLWAASVSVDEELLLETRQRFGDERIDYRAALDAHYEASDDRCRTSHISAYAAAHPWEDFAESVAHVLHMDDVLDTLGTGSSEQFDVRHAR